MPEKDLEIEGKVWGGFKGECKNRCPYYLIKKPMADGIFVCSILKKFANKRVRITFKAIAQAKDLVPFELGETVELKGCYFEVVSISPDPYNYVLLEGMSKREFEESKKAETSKVKD